MALLPKNADIERPITLTSITYRLWCFCRAQVVKKWMRETAERFPWDKASPGNTCLETGMQRLLRGEVSRAANKHACAVLLDLQTFYDSVNWTKLEERIVATGFPPALALLVMQVYRGTRYLVAEDLLSEGILPARGILAGCPFATMMARVDLQPIMQEAAQLRSITALDTWVDDIGADVEARYPEQAAFAVYEGYKTLRRLLEGSDLRLSLKKTGFLCTAAEARRELQKLRKDGDPAICDSMKDLGLDCALGRVRRVKVQRARRHKAGKRQKMSSVGDRYQDPGRTMMVQQVEAWFQLKKRWVGKEELLERTWGLTVHRLEEASSRWQMVRGPLAATVAYLLDMGWQPRGSDEWLDTHGTKHTIHTPQQEGRVLDLLQQTYQKEVNHRIATGLAAPELQEGVDWTVGRKLLGEFKKEGRTTKAAALRCVWQGALVCSQNSAVKVCPRCHEETWFQEGRAQGPRSLWTRGLPPKPKWEVQPPQEDNPIFLGIWANKEALNDRSLCMALMLAGGPIRRTRDSGRWPTQ